MFSASFRVNGLGAFCFFSSQALVVRLKYSHPGTVHTDFDTASALNPTSFSVALAPSHTPGLQVERGLI